MILNCLQMPKRTALQHTDLKCGGYTYQGPDGMEMCDFHIDDKPDELVSMFLATTSIQTPYNSFINHGY